MEVILTGRVRIIELDTINRFPVYIFDLFSLSNGTWFLDVSVEKIV